MSLLRLKLNFLTCAIGASVRPPMAASASAGPALAPAQGNASQAMILVTFNIGARDPLNFTNPEKKRSFVWSWNCCSQE